MASVDSRIVTMKFDNTQFQRGVSDTQSSLDKLKASMNFSSATSGAKTALGGLLGSLGNIARLRNPFSRSTTGVQELQGATNRFSTASMTGAVTGVSKSFIALSTVAVTALATITASAVTAGAELAKSLTLDPLMEGFKEYEMKMGSIQAILANTSGASLKEVNDALDELNHYSDKTIYNFGEMVSNIKTFTVAGIDLKTSVSSVKGLANVAALTGTNAQEAARATYQMAQAMSSGTVRLQDWISMEHAGGMAGKIFQDSLIRTAEVHGVNVDKLIKKNGSFRLSLQEDWLSTDILTETLGQYSGIYSKAQLSQMGYTDEQIRSIQKLQEQAQSSAQDVKTFSALMSTIKEGIASGWSETWEIVFGDLKEATKLWTGVNNSIGAMIGKSSDARNALLHDWDALGGRTALIESISNIWDGLLSILTPIKDAFRDVFPAHTAESLYDLTVRFREFTEGLTIGKDTAEALKSTFRGVFSIFSIVGKVIGGVVGVIARLVGALGDGEGGILNFTGGLGDFLYSVDQALEKGDGLANFFDGLGDVLEVPVKLLAAVAGWIGDLFSGFDGSSASDLDSALGDIGDKLSPLEVLGERVEGAFEGLADIFGKVKEALEPLTSAIGDALSGAADALGDAFSGGNFDKALDAINTGLFAGLIFLFRRFVNQGMSLFGGGQGVLGKIGQSFDAVTGSLEAMQANLQSKTLMNLAIAIGLLTVSVVALSLIDSAKLTKALTAMSVAFAQLLGAMAILTKLQGAKGFARIPMIAGSLILLSTALLILTGAIMAMSRLSWEEVAKGLIGVGGAMVILAGGAALMSGMSGPLIRAGASMILLAIGLRIMANAVEAFGEMDMATIAKGLAAVAASLVIVAGAMLIMPPNMFVTAAALTVLGVALNLIANAVEEFGSLSVGEIAKGLVALAGSLLIIAGAMWLMPPHMVLMAAGLVGVGIALNFIATAVKTMGGMSWEEIAKGLVALGGSLLILAGGLYLMTGALAGAAALVVAAGALALLVPPLVILGSMSWGGILKALVGLAGAFTVLGVAGLLLTPLVPVLLGLGAAVTLLGAGVLMAGAGIYFLAKAFRIVAQAGSQGTKVMGKAIMTFVRAIPNAAKAFARGLIEFVKIIGRAGSTFVKAFSTILSSILRAIIKNAPLIGQAFNRLMDVGLSAITRNAPKIIRAGFKLMLDFLRAVRQNIGDIVNIATDIIVKFINAVANNQQRVIQAGVNLIIKFINGVANTIDNSSARLGEAGGRLAVAIIRGMANGIASGAGVVYDAVQDLASNALDSAKNFLGISSPSKEFAKIGKFSSEGFAVGIDAYSPKVRRSAERVGKGALRQLKTTMSGLSRVVGEEMNLNPKVTPVLDLTGVRKDADKMTSMIGKQHIRADVSYDRASSISAERQAAQEAESRPAGTETPGPAEVKFEQNNYSPKALSPVEIYRNTRSQIALAEEALKKR